jgi:protease I
MSNLTGLNVAVFAADGFEESELTEPVGALKDAGAKVTVFSPKGAEIQAFRHLEKGITIHTDRPISEADPNEFDAAMLPGGAVSADTLRVIPEVKSFLRAMQESHKPIAAICHAAWELVSAGLVEGRTLTSYHTIQDDIRNAGGTWIDQELVENENWVTSRQPSDLPAFKEAMLSLFAHSLEGAHH